MPTLYLIDQRTLLPNGRADASRQNLSKQSIMCELIQHFLLDSSAATPSSL